MKEKIKEIFSSLLGFGIMILIIYGVVALFNGRNNNYNDQAYEHSDYSPSGAEEAERPDGTYMVEACNTQSGKCYDLDADIFDGTVETIYFPNGGHLDLDGVELDENGYGIGESYTHSEGYDGSKS